MARLPDLKTEGVYVELPSREEWAIKTKSLYNFMGHFVRNGVAKEKIEMEEKKGE